MTEPTESDREKAMEIWAELDTDTKYIGVVGVLHHDTVIPFLASALAAVRAETVEQQWHPIETAPKDGTIILVAGHGYNGRGPWYVTPARWDRDTWMQYDPLAEAAEEYKGEYTIESDLHTHWMPLPTPPALANPGDNNV